MRSFGKGQADASVGRVFRNHSVWTSFFVTRDPFVCPISNQSDHGRQGENQQDGKRETLPIHGLTNGPP